MMATRRRFHAPGRLTNYEMEIMREKQIHRYVDGRRVRYSFMWESLSVANHPMSRADWERQQEHER